MLVCNVIRSKGGNEYTVYDELGSKYTVSLKDLKRLQIPFTGRDEDYPLEINEGFREQLAFSHDKLRCLKYLQWYIENYGEKSKKRLFEKCRENGYKEPCIVEAIDILCEYSVIDEVRSCERKITVYSRDKLYGKYRIKNELYAKGYERESIEEAFRKCNEDFYENALKMYRKLTKKGIPQDAKEKKKIADKMVRYGYSYDEIKYASSVEYEE